MKISQGNPRTKTQRSYSSMQLLWGHDETVGR